MILKITSRSLLGIFLTLASLLISYEPSTECSISKFIVEPKNETCFQTIQDAVNAAVNHGGGTVFVKPGRYVENLDLRMLKKSNVTILGAVALGDDGQCEIVGTHTPPISGSVVLRNFKLTSDLAIFCSDDKGEGHLVLMDAYLNVKNGYTFDVPNWKGVLEIFDVNRGNLQDGGIRNKGGASVFIYNAGLGSGAEHEMIISGSLVAFCSAIGSPVKIMGNAQFYIDNSVLLGSLTTTQAAQGSITNSHMKTGLNTSICHNAHGILTVSNTTIDSSSNVAIVGSGEIKIGSITFMDSSEVVGVRLETSTYFRSGTIVVDGFEIIESEESKKMGVVTLIEGKATAYTTAVKENSRIFLTPQTSKGVSGFVRVNSRLPGQSFTIFSSSPSDYSTIAWLIIDPSG